MESPSSASAGGDSPPEWLVRFTQFTDHVAELCIDPAMRADLRHARTVEQLEQPLSMLPHLLPYMPRNRDRQMPYLYTAAMYAQQSPSAAHPKKRVAPSTYESWHGNLGWSLHQASIKKVFRDDLVSRRLNLISRQESLAGVYTSLRPLVQLLHQEGVPVSWPRLLRDLTRWNQWREDVTRDWFTDLYAPASTTAIED